MDDGAETYLMLLLADGNLPTGSFVASSGLESFISHGFFTPAPPSPSSSPAPRTAALTNQSILNFIHDNLASYARTALPFVSDAHHAVERYKSDSSPENLDVSLRRLRSLDSLYHNMNLNDVVRRASKSQGVALLTLYSKGFSKPLLQTRTHDGPDTDSSLQKLVDAFKLQIRRGDASGHHPICWGVLTAALGLSLDRSHFLSLFLQARSILSSSIRLNSIGPYAAQQILLHDIRSMVEEQMKMRMSGTGLLNCTSNEDSAVEGEIDGVANTWPLGELLMGRHDLLHSRIFNS